MNRLRNPALRRSLVALTAIVCVTALNGLSAHAQLDPTDIESRLSSLPELQNLPSVLDDAESGFKIASAIGLPAIPPAYNRILADNCKLLNNDGSTKKEFAKKKSTWSGVATFAATPSTNPGQVPEPHTDTTFTPSLTGAWEVRSNYGHCYLDTVKGIGAFDPHWKLTTRIDANVIDAMDDETDDVSSAVLSTAFSINLGTARTTSQKLRTRLILEAKHGVNYGDLYKDWSTTTYTGAVKLSHFLFENATGSAKIDGAVGYQRANPETSSYGYASLEVSRIFPNMFNSPQWSMTAKASAGYRDYNEATTQREDAIYSGSLILVRRLADGVELNMGVNVGSRDSTDDRKTYEAISLPFTFGLTRTF